MPILSVVVPVQDRLSDLIRAIGSIEIQGVNCEIVVVDDGSAVPVQLAWLPSLTNASIRIVRHEENQGPAAARNTGLGEARGEWVAFLDSDDIWSPGSLRPRLAALQAQARLTPGALVAGAAGFRYVDAEMRTLRERIPCEPKHPLWFASGCWYCPGSTAIVPRERMLAEVGPQDERLRRLEDLDWFLRFALAGGRLTIWRQAAAEIRPSLGQKLDQVGRASEILLAKYARVPMASGAGLDRADVLRRLSAYLELEKAAAARYEQRWAISAAHLARSLVLRPRRRIHLERFWCVD